MSLLIGWSTTSEATDLQRFCILDLSADRTTFNPMIYIIPFFQAYKTNIKMTASIG